MVEQINNILKQRNNNVNVDNNILNNVYDENTASKIKDAVDKPRAIAQDLAEKLDAPQNIRLYINLAYKYPTHHLYTCLALTNEAYREKRIKTTRAQYFYGIVWRT